MDDTQLDIFPQLKINESVAHIFNTLQQARFKCKVALIFILLVVFYEYLQEKKRH